MSDLTKIGIDVSLEVRLDRDDHAKYELQIAHELTKRLGLGDFDIYFIDQASEALSQVKIKKRDGCRSISVISSTQ